MTKIEVQIELGFRLVDMNSNLIQEILKTFGGNSYEDFLKYFYFYYDKKITLEKSQNVKNKYIMIRKNILSYILANKNKIMAEINNRKNK